jgi:UPF0755 protein
MTDDEFRPDPRPKAPSSPPAQRPVPMKTTQVAGPQRDDSTTPRSAVDVADPAAGPEVPPEHPGLTSPLGGPPRSPIPPWGAPDEWVEVGPRSGPLRRLAITFGAIAVVLVLLSAFVLRWLNGEIHPAGDPGAAVTFTIATGASTNDVASDLAAAGIVGNPTVFRYWLRREAGDISFQAGEYDLHKRTDFPELLTELRAGPKPPVAFKEKMLQQLPRFNAAEFDQAIASPELNPPYGTPGMLLPIREGLLFPDTYSVDENSASNELALLRRMRAGMDKVLTDLGAADKAKALGLDTYKILIVASLIEEEAKVDGDRAKISRVIYNRLAANEPLGIDASTRFAVGKTAGQPLTQSDLDVDSGWNLRKNRGLPPTPIASPSRKSIEAALNPADGPWFYYVLTDEGGVRGAHTFATTAKEFEAAKKICIDKGYC